nr:HtaA domain-containing protein [Vibrio vulnificus]
MTTATRARAVRRGGMLLAAATATVLCTTGFAAPAFADERPGATAFDLVDGTLDWGVKNSFNRYISGPIAGGTITTDDGAEQHGEQREELAVGQQPEDGFRQARGVGAGEQSGGVEA